MRVRSYFLIAGAVPICLAMAFVAWVTFISDWVLTGERLLFGRRFPPIAQWETLKVTLDRTVCFGTCPDYSVEIHGDGTAFYTGRMFVAVFGRHTMHISPASVRMLFEKFKAARFFAMSDEYRYAITDNPTYTMTIAFDGHHKAVEDYAGRRAHMPPEITELEHAIDDATNMQLWVHGKGNVAAALEAEHWDFHAASSENYKIISAAKERGDWGLVKKMVAAETVPASPEKSFISPRSP